MPADGQALQDLLPPGPSTLQIEGAPILPPNAGWLGITDEADAAWVVAKMTPQPLRTFAKKLRLSKPLTERTFSRIYVRCTGDPGARSDPSPFDQFAAKPRNDPAWRYRELATGHDAMVTVPRELASLLLDVTSSV